MQLKPWGKRINHWKPCRRRNAECAMRHCKSLVLTRTGKNFCPGDCGAKGYGCYARAGDPTSPCWCALIRSFWRLETPSLSKMLVR